MNNMRDSLYDADNGNIDTLGFSKHSKPGYGGGEIWFDDVLIRKMDILFYKSYSD